MTSNPDQNRRASEVLTIGSVLRGESIGYLSLGEFDEDYLARYEHNAELESCLQQAIQELADESYLDGISNAQVMGRAMENLRSLHNLSVPRGWYPAMKRLRTQPVRKTLVAPDELLALKEALFPPESFYWYRTNKFITDLEVEVLVRLSTADHDRYPQLYSLYGQ
jgi:hypothetical protein